jgi:ankyrin repeat protein
LHFAASVGYRDVAELLASRADVNARDKDGWTPLHYAEANGYEDVTKLLRQRDSH